MLTQIFPWSSEGRILSFLIEEKMNNDDYHITSEINTGASISTRTVLQKMQTLEDADLVERTMLKDGKSRVRIAYRLKESSVTSSLLRFINEMTDAIIFKSQLINTKASDSPVESLELSHASAMTHERSP